MEPRDTPDVALSVRQPEPGSATAADSRAEEPAISRTRSPQIASRLLRRVGYGALAVFSFGFALLVIAWIFDFDFRFENNTDRAIREFASNHRGTDLRFPGAAHQPTKQLTGRDSYDLSSSALSFVEREIDEALAKQPGNSKLIFRRAQIHLLYLQPTQAIDLLERLRPFSPDDPAILGALGYAHYLRGRSDRNTGELLRAVDFFNHALRVTPQDPVLLFNVAVAHQRLGNRKAATELFSQLLEMEQNSDWVRETRSRLQQVSR